MKTMNYKLAFLASFLLANTVSARPINSGDRWAVQMAEQLVVGHQTGKWQITPIEIQETATAAQIVFGIFGEQYVDTGRDEQGVPPHWTLQRCSGKVAVITSSLKVDYSLTTCKYVH
jgi:hypothetical protein